MKIYFTSIINTSVIVELMLLICLTGCKAEDNRREDKREVAESIYSPRIQKSYSTDDRLKMTILNLDQLKMPIDSIVVEIINYANEEAIFGEYYKIEMETDGKWETVPLNRKPKNLKVGDVVDIFFNDVGYPVLPHSSRTYSNPTRAYNENLTKGHYRLSKTFHYPPSPTFKSDTAYVEFEF